METLISYVVAHACLVVGCWLLTCPGKHTLPPPTRYLGGNSIIKKQAIGVRTTQLWF